MSAVINMSWHVLIALLLYLMELNAVPTPIRLTIDCGVENRNKYEIRPRIGNILSPSRQFDVDTFCHLIQKAIPKAVQDGKYFLVEQDKDLVTQEDTVRSSSLPAPKTYDVARLDDVLEIPRFKLPRLKVPKINVPKLRAPINIPNLKAPAIGEAMKFPSLKETLEEESSAEKMERFKKGIRKMLHVVKVLGQVDQYLSERMRIVVEKLSKTFD